MLVSYKRLILPFSAYLSNSDFSSADIAGKRSSVSVGIYEEENNLPFKPSKSSL